MKKSTPYAAQQAVESALAEAKDTDWKLALRCKEPGSGRETAIKSVSEGIKVLWIEDVSASTT